MMMLMIDYLLIQILILMMVGYLFFLRSIFLKAIDLIIFEIAIEWLFFLEISIISLLDFGT